jgi:hypothetical protein
MKAAAYGPSVPSARSVLSSVRLTPEQLAWLAQLFGARDDGYGWTIELGSGIMEAIADGTEDISSMPPQIVAHAAQWLGGLPQYRLSISVGDTPACRDLAWTIANEFAKRWPAVWSDHSTSPVVPLGNWWGQQQ